MRRLSAAMVLLISIAIGLGAVVVAQERAPNGAQAVENSRLLGFVITLLLGDTQGSSSGTFTPAEVKALADLKGFLPYKAYRRLDTARVIGLNGPHLLLRGVDGQKHDFYMRSTVVSPKITSVGMLRLWEASPAKAAKGASVVLLIDTSFKITLGETVVVGSSELEGDRGLILLVTAAARQSSESE